MKRRIMTLEEIQKESWQYYLLNESELNELDICALVNVEDVGWCESRQACWYKFHDENGKPAIYYDEH